MGTLLVRGLLAVALLLTFVFPAWAQDAKGIGVVTALTGQAGLKRPQAPETPLKLRDNLFVRDVVDTQKESVARILLMGKSTVTVRELSRFEIREETRPDGSQRGLINLAEGKIRVMVARRLMKPGDEVEIRTPNAIAGVRGSDGIIEVSKLPDGRPQTVITGVSGEFQLTLPTTPPFIANGREFQEGPALASGAPRRDSPLLAMAETVSDAGSGLQLAQLPTALNVTALVQAQITGAAGVQISTFVQLTLQQVLGIAGNYQLRVPPPPPPPAANDRVMNTGTALATTATLASGAQPGLGGGLPSGGGRGGIIPTPVITPVSCPPACPKITQSVEATFSFTQTFSGTYEKPSSSPFSVATYQGSGTGTRTGVYPGALSGNFSIVATSPETNTFSAFSSGTFAATSISGTVRGRAGGVLTGMMNVNAATSGGTNFMLSGPVTLQPSGHLTYSTNGTFSLGVSGTTTGTWTQTPTP